MAETLARVIQGAELIHRGRLFVITRARGPREGLLHTCTVDMCGGQVGGDDTYIVGRAAAGSSCRESAPQPNQPLDGKPPLWISTALRGTRSTGHIEGVSGRNLTI
ncbi:predicted protein [Histoplasma capsulatum H143]|uniref:Uncharacterized protein n=1 Tax=Ajellomyces capsulatus (strain H143) TaxID=544712 RepID=C6H660_AJECH|nr:predicted protein [Histoplasma capsulatum H143]